MNTIKFLLPLVALLFLCACGNDDAMEELENSDQIIRFKIDRKQYEAAQRQYQAINQSDPEKRAHSFGYAA